jgi:hypothetical protein
MGLIRKALNLGSAGAVRPESKKQRYARTAARIPSQSERAAEGWKSLRKPEPTPETDPFLRLVADAEKMSDEELSVPELFPRPGSLPEAELMLAMETKLARDIVRGRRGISY